MFLQRFNLRQVSSLFLSPEKGHELFVSLQADITCTFSGTCSYSSEMISLRDFTGAIVCHKLVCTPRAWGMNSPVTHILTPWKVLIGLPGTSCEPIYLAGSHKYQTALCFPFLQCPGNLCFWNFFVNVNSINHASTEEACGNKSAELPNANNFPPKKFFLPSHLLRKKRERERKEIKPINSLPHYDPYKPRSCWGSDPLPSPFTFLILNTIFGPGNFSFV